jgi:hypothetical protein
VNFDGFGLFIQPQDSVKEGETRAIKVAGVMSNSPDEECSCYWPVINAHGWSRLSLEYSDADQTLSVSFLSAETSEFHSCFVTKASLDFEGYFVIVASSGDFMPHEISLDSF